MKKAEESSLCTKVKKLETAKAALEQKYKMELEKLDKEIATEC